MSGRRKMDLFRKFNPDCEGSPMLVFSRKAGESFQVVFSVDGAEQRAEVILRSIDHRRNRIKVAVDAPRSISVIRTELVSEERQQ